MPQKRLFGAAAVCASAVAAGIIESSSGSASVTPMPRRNVRRGTARFVMNVICASFRRSIVHARFHIVDSPLEWHAIDDAEDEIGKPIFLRRSAVHDYPDRRHVGKRRFTAQSV